MIGMVGTIGESTMTSAPSRVAGIVGVESTQAQSMLATAVARWRAGGAKVVGVLAEAHGVPGRTCGAGFLRDIATSRPYSIYREAVSSGTTCHLDASGVEAACENLRGQIPACDIVVLSKFGKLEAMRQGLASAFTAAMAAGKPVLTSISGKHRDAWQVFVPNATLLADDEAALEAWWREAGRWKDVTKRLA
jgi:hypothetical protein